MGFISSIASFFDVPQAYEAKGYVNAPANRTPQQISALVESDFGGFGSEDNFCNSVVYACARVIAEGLALPECYVRQTVGNGRKLAVNHPLFPLLNAAPNDRQTAYGFREFIGFHLAMYGNAYVYIVRSPRTGEILELLPCDPGMVSVSVNDAQLFNPLQYFLFGQPVPAANIWHLKGPSWFTYQGNNTVGEARSAIGLANANESYGANLFKNGAKPGGIVAPKDGTALTPEQAQSIKEQWTAQQQGVGNAHKTLFLTGPVGYTPMGTTANDAQWIESRRFQIEEICRYFRVSPTKVFQNLGSQSYASVEQAHIAHQFDTDQQWQARFVQSANAALFTPKERAAGFAVSLDHRAVLNGTTAAERMAYWIAGVSAGIFTQNEARTGEGYDPSDDPEADKLKQAVNIMPPPPIVAKSPDTTADDQPKKQ
jgi:HK97 family phage portal protein